MQRAIVAFKIQRRNNDRINYARSVAVAMTGNPHFPSPTPPLADFEAHIDAAAAANAFVLIGPIGSAAQRDATLAAVQSDLEQLRSSYVQRVADARRAKRARSGPASMTSHSLRSKRAPCRVQWSSSPRQRAIGRPMSGSTRGWESRGWTWRPQGRRRRCSTDSSLPSCTSSGSAR
jgi:hypothetical protein